MVFNATFNNISVISWWSILFVEETGENHQPDASHWRTLSHNIVLSTPCHEGVQSHNFTDCICSCKSNYHTITSRQPRKDKEKQILEVLYSNAFLGLVRIYQHFPSIFFSETTGLLLNQPWLGLVSSQKLYPTSNSPT
jgi:hypothetical protein